MPELSEALLYAPAVDEGKRDVETYMLPSGDDIEDPQLRKAWELARQMLTEGGEIEEESESKSLNGYGFKSLAFRAELEAARVQMDAAATISEVGDKLAETFKNLGGRP